jgi:hypothetical protein
MYFTANYVRNVVPICGKTLYMEIRMILVLRAGY